MWTYEDDQHKNDNLKQDSDGKFMDHAKLELKQVSQIEISDDLKWWKLKML